MRKALSHWAGRGFLVLMLLGSALISVMSLPYFDFETLPPFVIEKLPLRFEALWLGALRVHVAAAALSFPLCLALMTRSLQRRVGFHRWLGRVSGGLMLCALLPSGIVLAFDAKGGPVVSAGFLLSALIIAIALILGVRAARRRDLILHGRAMRHVLGQMSVAVVSRALIVALDAIGVDPDVAYVAALWGPVLASVLVVEWQSRRPLPWFRNPIQLSERIPRELSAFALVLRVRALFYPVARDSR
jgi:threonine/homoserine/homoserine lactone efflux protein